MAKVIIKGDRGGGMYYEWKNIRNGSPNVFEPLEMTLILSQGLGEQCMSPTYAVRLKPQVQDSSLTTDL